MTYRKRKKPMTAAAKAKADEKREAKRERVRGLLDRAPEAMCEPGVWAKFLAGPGAAPFLKANGEPYSANNQLLIFQQDPDATDVAGFVRWRERGRQVVGSGNGILVFAPVPRKKDDEPPPEEGGRRPGEMSSDDLKSKLRGTKLAFVWDIRHTEPIDGAEFIPRPDSRRTDLEEIRALIVELAPKDQAAKVTAAMDEAVALTEGVTA